LNKQQTLKNDDDFIRNFIRFNNTNQIMKRTKSATDLANKSTLNKSNPNYNNMLTKSYAGYSTISKADLNKLKNSLRMTSANSSKYMELPLSKSVIHSKPWTPGKVETIYYPYRDTKINKKSTNTSHVF
jgi:hypothetical protein